MSDSADAGQVSQSAAEIYDTFFVPALFGAWAAPLCDAAHIGSRDAVLDVACGTGATTREAASRLDADSKIVGLDRNAGMLEVAELRAPDIKWIDGTAEELPFDDASFDVVLCQFGLMFFDDREKALSEMLRVLRAGGRIAVSVWDDVANSPGYADMIELIQSMFGDEPANALRAPFALGSKDSFRQLLTAGGLDGATVKTWDGTAHFESIREWVRMDVYGWTLADFIDEAGYEALVAAAEEKLAQYAGDDGSVSFPIPAHIALWEQA